MNALNGLRLLLQDLRHDTPRTLLTVLTLSLVMTIHLATASISGALALLRSDSLAGAHNLLILSANVLDPTDSLVFDEQLNIALQLVATQGSDNIQKASPLILRHLRIEGHILQVAAAPTGDLQNIYQLRLLQDRFPQSPDEVVVTTSTQALIGKGPGDILTIYGSPFRVSGLVDVPGNRAGVWMAYDAGIKLLNGQPGFQIGVLQLSPQAEPNRLQELLQADPRLEGYAIYQEQQFASQFSLSLEQIVLLARFFNLVSLSVVVFGAYNVTQLGLVERSAELGMLRALGFSETSLRALVLVRTVLLGMLAFAISLLVISLSFQSRQEPVMLHVNQLRLQLTTVQAAWALALCILFSCLGAWVPSFLLFRQSAADLIQEAV